MSEIPDSVLPALSEAISAAAVNPAEWPAFLDRFAAATRSNRVSLHKIELSAAPQASYLFSYDTTGTYTESKKRELEQHYAPLNPLVIHGRSILVPGRPGHRLEACSDEIYLKSEFYNDFMRPNDTLQIFGGVLIQTGEAAVLLSASGSHSREPFGDSDLRLLGALMPHLQTTFYLQERLHMTGDRYVRVKAAFETHPDALLLIADGARVLESNHAALINDN